MASKEFSRAVSQELLLIREMGCVRQIGAALNPVDRARSSVLAYASVCHLRRR